METKWVMIDNRLQARLVLPPLATWCAVLTHPHPKLGGDLANNVVVAIAEELKQLGVATITFNTRGIGKSLGHSTWRGIDERDDVKTVVNYAWTLPGVKRVALVAYSFGAAVGLSVSAELVRENKLNAVVAVGYPKGFWAWFLFSSHYPLIDPKGTNIPKLFVLGDEDNFTSVSTMKALFEEVSEPKQLIIVKGADHFCFEREHLLSDPVKAFFQSTLLSNY